MCGKIEGLDSGRLFLGSGILARKNLKEGEGRGSASVGDCVE